MDKVERATWEICCRNCAPTKPGGVIPERPRNGFLISGTVIRWVFLMLSPKGVQRTNARRQGARWSLLSNSYGGVDIPDSRRKQHKRSRVN